MYVIFPFKATESWRKGTALQIKRCMQCRTFVNGESLLLIASKTLFRVRSQDALFGILELVTTEVLDPSLFSLETTEETCITEINIVNSEKKKCSAESITGIQKRIKVKLVREK